MTETLIVCRWCSKPTHPAWEAGEEWDFDTRGATFWRRATILVKMTELPAKDAARVEFSFSMDGELASKIDERMIADLISREFGKMARKHA